MHALVSRSGLVLDFGCGWGRVSALLRDAGYANVVGVDPAPAMIAAARTRCPRVRFELLADPPHVPLDDASADAALLFSVLTCVPSDEEQRATVGELRRVLRPGGLLYISDFWLQDDARNRARYDAGRAKHGTYGVFDLEEGATMRHHDRAWIDSLTSGFARVAIDEIAVRTMNGHDARGFQWFGRNV